MGDSDMSRKIADDRHTCCEIVSALDGRGIVATRIEIKVRWNIFRQDHIDRGNRFRRISVRV